MPQAILTNTASLNAQRNLTSSQRALNTSLERLSSGKRINSARDDAAGLAISERLTAQIRGLNQAVRNANDGISLAQTGESSLSEMSNMLQRIRELSVQSLNASNLGADRTALQSEVGQLVSELDRMAQTTSFNGQKLFNGTFGTANFQVGANASQVIGYSATNFRTTQYGTYRVQGTASGANATSSRVNAQTLTISGGNGNSSTVSVGTGDSALTMRDNINAVTDTTGVYATAESSIAVSFAATGNYILELTSDNSSAVTVSFNVSATTGESGLSAAIDAFNAVTSKTGVTAELTAGGASITLKHSNGNDMTIADTTTANAGNVTVGGTTLTADTTADTSVVTGRVTFYSDKSFNVATGGTTGEALDNASESSALQTVASLDITTTTNANAAIEIVDGALSTINNHRARIGALQARFESAINTLQAASENFSAARSRVADADFAAETADLTRNNILQQAGIAMLSQANSLPQQVLSLIQ